MAKTTTKKSDQQYQAGETVQFKGYTALEDGQEELLTAGESVEITSYTDEDGGLYNVKNSEGIEDSVFASELERPATKASAKKAPATEKTTVTKKAAKAKKVIVLFAGFDKDTIPSEEQDALVEGQEMEVVSDDGDTVTCKFQITWAGEDGEGDVTETYEQVFQRTEVDGLPEATTKTKAEKPAKVEKVKVEKAQKVELPAFKKTASVSAILKENGGDALEAAKSLVEQKEHTTFSLGGILAYIKRNDIHAEIMEGATGKYEYGLKGFNAYVYDELGIQARTADYYVNLYEKFSQLVPESKLANIGWTKLRELLPLNLDKENVDEWLKQAKASTTSELKESVRTSLVNGEGKVHGSTNLSKKVAFRFIAFDDQAEVWNAALEKAKESLGEDADNSAALNHIITEWVDAQG